MRKYNYCALALAVYNQEFILADTAFAKMEDPQANTNLVDIAEYIAELKQEGLTWRNIGELLGIKPDTAHSRYRRKGKRKVG